MRLKYSVAKGITKKLSPTGYKKCDGLREMKVNARNHS